MDCPGLPQIFFSRRPGQSFLASQSHSFSYRPPPRLPRSPDHRHSQLALRRERTPAVMLLTTQGVNPFRRWCLVRHDLVPPSLPWTFPSPTLSLTSCTTSTKTRQSTQETHTNPLCNLRQLPRCHSPGSQGPRCACLQTVAHRH